MLKLWFSLISGFFGFDFNFENKFRRLIIIQNNYFIYILYSMPNRTVKRRTRGGGFFDWFTGNKTQNQVQNQMYGQNQGQTPGKLQLSPWSNLKQRFGYSQRQSPYQSSASSSSSSPYSFFGRRQPQPQRQVERITPSYIENDENDRYITGGGRRRKNRKTRKGRKMRTRKNR